MSNDREFEKIKELQWEAYSAGLCKKSAEIARRGAELAGTTGNATWRICFLFWHGEALRRAGDWKAAQIPLLEAARPDPEADPADQYNALTALISIAMRESEAGYCRHLITQGRDYLAAVHKESWSHKLDSLEGGLELGRGAFALAESCYQRAWNSAPKGAYPGYTSATYADNLVQTAFAQRNVAALSNWQARLQDSDKVGEGDKIMEKAGLLLLMRARRAEEGLASAVPAALDLLRHVQALEDSAAGENLVALRTLAIAGHWAALDDWLARLRLDEVGFDNQIFCGDERLCRARHALGMPARDDEWDQGLEELCPPSSPILEPARRDEAVTFLYQARGHYESVLAKAEAEDRRLETTWYTNTLEQRLARLSALAKH